MEQLLLYFGFTISGFAYLVSVIYCSFDHINDAWWEPWVIGAIWPFLWLYDNRMGIMSCAVSLGALGSVVFVLSLIGDLFRWLGGLL